MKYTVFIREADNTGTTYITSIEADTVEEATEGAQDMCRYDWSAEGVLWPGELHVLGVARGDVDILEWDDLV